MNQKSTENFHQSLLFQYRDLIEEAILESEFDHKTGLNTHLFDAKLMQIYQAGQVDGVSEDEVRMLIQEVLYKHSEYKKVA